MVRMIKKNVFVATALVMIALGGSNCILSNNKFTIAYGGLMVGYGICMLTKTMKDRQLINPKSFLGRLVLEKEHGR